MERERERKRESTKTFRKCLKIENGNCFCEFVKNMLFLLLAPGSQEKNDVIPNLANKPTKKTGPLHGLVV
jgi:hypothetical protein